MIHPTSLGIRQWCASSCEDWTYGQTLDFQHVWLTLWLSHVLLVTTQLSFYTELNSLTYWYFEILIRGSGFLSNFYLKQTKCESISAMSYNYLWRQMWLEMIGRTYKLSDKMSKTNLSFDSVGSRTVTIFSTIPFFNGSGRLYKSYGKCFETPGEKHAHMWSHTAWTQTYNTLNSAHDVGCIINCDRYIHDFPYLRIHVSEGKELQRAHLDLQSTFRDHYRLMAGWPVSVVSVQLMHAFQWECVLKPTCACEIDVMCFSHAHTNSSWNRAECMRRVK